MKRIFLTLIFALCLAPRAEAAIGDAVAPTCSSVATTAVLDIQPAAGVEWLVHNIWFEDNITVQRFDGTNTINAVSLLGPDYQPLMTRVTNTNRIRIRNDAGTNKLICFDGIVTKE